MRINPLHALVIHAVTAVALAGALWSVVTPSIQAQGGITVTVPPVLAAGPDFATDVIGDAWDMSNPEDLAVDPSQRTGWTNLALTQAGRLGGTLAAVDGHLNGSNVALLERAYRGIINPGRTGAKFPIDSTKYTKLAFKMRSDRGDQFPRVYWFHKDLGDPGGDGSRYVDRCHPCGPSPAGDQIFVVDLADDLGSPSPWVTAPVRGLSLFPNSSAVGYYVDFDWVRLTSGDASPQAATQVITWTGGAGAATIQVIDAAGTVFTVASGVTGTSYSWNYGVLPPGAYTVRVTRGAAVGSSALRINAPPTLRITDPDATGGEDFATRVLGNPWDMNDAADIGTVFEDHLIARSFSGGQFHGTSDTSSDPIVYPLTNNGIVDTSRYRYLTYRLQVDGGYDLGLGSVARVFWGSVPGAPYNVTVSKDIIVWPGMNSYTIDLASLTTDSDGGIVSTEGAKQLWTAANVRYLRLDPHEFPEQRTFHIDDVKLTAMDETTSNQFTIRFTGADADGDPATVAFYYDTDRDAANGNTPIASDVPLGSGQFVWNTGGVPAGVYYIFAVASDGRNSFGTFAGGPIRVIAEGPASSPLFALDQPASGSHTSTPFQVLGWAADVQAPSGTGVDAVHVYAFPNYGSGQAPIFLGIAAYGQARPDVGAALGAQFTNSGYSFTVGSLAPGPYLLAVYARSTQTGVFQSRTAAITIPGPTLVIDQPTAGAALEQPFTMSGWSIDPSASSGTGVDALHVWAYPNPGSGAAPIFVAVAQFGLSRPDVGALLGPRFTNSGYSLSVKGLAPGPYDLVVFSHSAATGTFNIARAVRIAIRTAARMAIDSPVSGNLPRTFTISGWALDLAAAAGTGVDTIHVWAYKQPGSGTPPQFVGVAAYGTVRGDVGAAFGSSQFTPSGFNLTATLEPATYDLVVFAHSTVSNTFDNLRVVRITIP